MLLDLFLRERTAGRWPVSRAIAALPRARRAVVLPAGRRPRRASAPTPATKRACSSMLADRPAGRAGGRSRSPGPRPLDDERRLQVLPRRRLVAPRPDERHRAARPDLHRGDLGRGRATRSSRPASDWSAARDGPTTDRVERRDDTRGSTSRGATSSSGRDTDRYVGKVLTINAGRRLSLQYHERKDESILVPARARLRLHLEDDDGTMHGRGARPRRASPRPDRAHPSLRGDRRRRRAVEVSTPELDDVVRLEDDFGREGTNAP